MRLQKINFWKRLESFVADIKVCDCPGEEEKEMILAICKEKQSEKQSENKLPTADDIALSEIACEFIRVHCFNEHDDVAMPDEDVIDKYQDEWNLFMDGATRGINELRILIKSTQSDGEEFANWLHEGRWARHTNYKTDGDKTSMCMFRAFSYTNEPEIKSISELYKLFKQKQTA